MALDASSYASVGDVLALTRHMLEGGASFDATTRPSLTEVEAFIDDVSSVLNGAIAAAGFSVPITAASPKRSCDLWVRTKAAAFVELTQRGEGFGEEESSRYGSLWNLFGDAAEFVAMMSAGWVQQGATVTSDRSAGLGLTSLSIHSEREDPTISTREQPMFRRHQFQGDN